MRRALTVTLLCLVAVSVICQAPAAKWTVGTVLSVEPHKDETGVDAAAKRFDISVRVGDTIYVVLYTQASGTAGVEYRKGNDLPVSVGEKTMMFTTIQGVTKEVPILSQRPAPARDKQ